MNYAINLFLFMNKLVLLIGTELCYSTLKYASIQIRAG